MSSASPDNACSLALALVHLGRTRLALPAPASGTSQQNQMSEVRGRLALSHRILQRLLNQVLPDSDDLPAGSVPAAGAPPPPPPGSFCRQPTPDAGTDASRREARVHESVPRPPADAGRNANRREARMYDRAPRPPATPTDAGPKSPSTPRGPGQKRPIKVSEPGPIPLPKMSDATTKPRPKKCADVPKPPGKPVDEMPTEERILKCPHCSADVVTRLTSRGTDLMGMDNETEVRVSAELVDVNGGVSSGSACPHCKADVDLDLEVKAGVSNLFGVKAALIRAGTRAHCAPLPPRDPTKDKHVNERGATQERNLKCPHCSSDVKTRLTSRATEVLSLDNEMELKVSAEIVTEGECVPSGSFCPHCKRKVDFQLEVEPGVDDLIGVKAALIPAGSPVLCAAPSQTRPKPNGPVDEKGTTDERTLKCPHCSADVLTHLTSRGKNVAGQEKEMEVEVSAELFGNDGTASPESCPHCGNPVDLEVELEEGGNDQFDMKAALIPTGSPARCVALAQENEKPPEQPMNGYGTTEERTLQCPHCNHEVRTRMTRRANDIIGQENEMEVEVIAEIIDEDGVVFGNNCPNCQRPVDLQLKVENVGEDLFDIKASLIVGGSISHCEAQAQANQTPLGSSAQGGSTQTSAGASLSAHISGAGANRTGNVSGAGANRSANISGAGANRTGNVCGTGVNRSAHISGAGANRTGDVSGAGANRSANIRGTGGNRMENRTWDGRNATGAGENRAANRTWGGGCPPANVVWAGANPTGNVSGTDANRTGNVSGTGVNRSANISGTGANRSANISGAGANRTGDVSGAGANRSANIWGTGTNRMRNRTWDGRNPTGNVAGAGANRVANRTWGGGCPPPNVVWAGANPTGNVSGADANRTGNVSGTGVNRSANIFGAGANRTGDVSGTGVNRSANIRGTGGNRMGIRTWDGRNATGAGENRAANRTWGGGRPPANVVWAGANPSGNISGIGAIPSGNISRTGTNDHEQQNKDVSHVMGLPKAPFGKPVSAFVEGRRLKCPHCSVQIQSMITFNATEVIGQDNEMDLKVHVVMYHDQSTIASYSYCPYCQGKVEVQLEVGSGVNDVFGMRVTLIRAGTPARCSPVAQIDQCQLESSPVRTPGQRDLNLSVIPTVDESPGYLCTPPYGVPLSPYQDDSLVVDLTPPPPRPIPNLQQRQSPLQNQLAQSSDNLGVSVLDQLVCDPGMPGVEGPSGLRQYSSPSPGLFETVGCTQRLGGAPPDSWFPAEWGNPDEPNQWGTLTAEPYSPPQPGFTSLSATKFFSPGFGPPQECDRRRTN